MLIVMSSFNVPLGFRDARWAFAVIGAALSTEMVLFLFAAVMCGKRIQLRPLRYSSDAGRGLIDKACKRRKCN